MSTTESDLNETLALVNVVRQALGHDILTELPDSRPGAQADCLYYRALADCGVTSVGNRTMAFKDERTAAYVGSLFGTTVHGNIVDSPQQFQRVIDRFDTTKLDHYNTNEKKHF